MANSACLRRFAAFVVTMTVLVGVLNAQVRSTGEIAGTVSDPSGAIVPAPD